MSNKKAKAMMPRLLIVLLALMCLLFVLVACAPNASTESENNWENPNVSVVYGEFETIGEDPDMLTDGTSGTSVSEEAGDGALQQDRVSGGANKGGVVSKNLDPLENPLTEPQKEFN
jgi:ABC-type oligopeptide transport system substrate-binding subunit